MAQFTPITMMFLRIDAIAVLKLGGTRRTEKQKR